MTIHIVYKRQEEQQWSNSIGHEIFLGKVKVLSVNVMATFENFVPHGFL